MISGGGSNCAEDAERPVSPPSTDEGQGPLDRACIEAGLQDYHVTCSCPVHHEHTKVGSGCEEAGLSPKKQKTPKVKQQQQQQQAASRSFQALLIGPPNAAGQVQQEVGHLL